MSQPILLALCLALSAPIGMATAMAETSDGTATVATPRQTHQRHPAAAASEARKTPEATAADPAANMFKPYVHAGEGDHDGLSRDQEDCNKGCIDE